MSALNAELKLRVEEAVKVALERKAAGEERTPAAIARRYIREGLVRDGMLEEAIQRD